MGGVSRSGLEHDPAGHAVFKGSVSLERNGGFAPRRPEAGARHRWRTGALVRAIPVLGGFHHEYSLAPAAASL